MPLTRRRTRRRARPRSAGSSAAPLRRGRGLRRPRQPGADAARRPLGAASAAGGPGALTVDHGLRPESAAEARTVGGWLAARGIPHAMLAWAGRQAGRPASRRRRARRATGCSPSGAATHGCLHLLTAHHREDQAETHLIRRRAGSGPDGLAGMSAVRELPGCRLVRPLLGVPRARLAALLAAEGQPFRARPEQPQPGLRARPPAARAIEPRRRRRSPSPRQSRAAAAARIEREAALDRRCSRAAWRCIRPGSPRSTRRRSAAAGELRRAAARPGRRARRRRALSAAARAARAAARRALRAAPRARAAPSAAAGSCRGAAGCW